MYTTQGILRAKPDYRPHILLVEDEASVAKGLKMVMAEEGYDVDLADTGQGALHKFWTKDHFDLIVADLRLPDIDGMEVIRQIKEKQPEVKVVIITGYPSVPSAVEAVKMGVSDYLCKPFTEDEFIAAIGGILKAKLPEEPTTEGEKERLIQRAEVLRILDRACQDDDFWRELMEYNTAVLNDYPLSGAAKAAILSGDLKWIKENVGELTSEQLQLLYSRLEREVW